MNPFEKHNEPKVKVAVKTEISPVSVVLGLLLVAVSVLLINGAMSGI